MTRSVVSRAFLTNSMESVDCILIEYMMFRIESSGSRAKQSSLIASNQVVGNPITPNADAQIAGINNRMGVAPQNPIQAAPI